MGTSGFVYVLENSAIPDCVKIGKTTKDPVERAAQLSAATGVPQPFRVAYDAYFPDCEIAEMYVHALLEVQGLRVTTNREFFLASAEEAVAAVKQAEVKFAPKKAPGIDDLDEPQFSDELLTELTIADSEPWEAVLEEAESFDYGSDDELEDREKAVEKYKLAAKLGSAKAHIRLSEIFADDYSDKKAGLEWLKKGADKDMALCWVELGKVFSGTNIYFGEGVRNPENALKCFRRYLSYDNYEEYDSLHQGSTQLPFAILSLYLALAIRNPGSYRPDEAEQFASRLRDKIRCIPRIEEVDAKLEALRDLLRRYDQTRSLAGSL